MNASTRSEPGRADRRLAWSALLLGIALGGFFDGILLHQVLQWHHLLSGVRAEAMQDLRVQVLADGLFHLLMYGIALAGLAMMWTARRSPAPPTVRFLAGNALVGFGLWHVLDAVASHWVLGIHRIRMDSPNPLLWDLLWFFVFGVAMIAAGMLLRRGGRPSRTPRGALTAAVLLGMSTLLAGSLAALPPRDVSTLLVVMRPDADAGDLLDGLARVGGGILWANRSGSLWTVRLDRAGDASQLYRHGALLVTASPAALGCAAWMR